MKALKLATITKRRFFAFEKSDQITVFVDDKTFNKLMKKYPNSIFTIKSIDDRHFSEFTITITTKINGLLGKKTVKEIIKAKIDKKAYSVLEKYYYMPYSIEEMMFYDSLFGE